MGHVMFDTLAYSDKLKSVGITTEQARVLVEMQAETIKSTFDALVTKQDLKEEIGILRLEVREMKTEIMKWVIGLLFIQSGFIIGVTKLISH